MALPALRGIFGPRSVFYKVVLPLAIINFASMNLAFCLFLCSKEPRRNRFKRISVGCLAFEPLFFLAGRFFSFQFFYCRLCANTVLSQINNQSQLLQSLRAGSCKSSSCFATVLMNSPGSELSLLRKALEMYGAASGFAENEKSVHLQVLMDCSRFRSQKQDSHAASAWSRAIVQQLPSLLASINFTKPASLNGSKLRKAVQFVEFRSKKDYEFIKILLIFLEFHQ